MRARLLLESVVFVVTAMCSLGAQAETYWLGTGANASDSNAGTSKDAPFATWEHAYAAVGAANNNTLNILPGEYTLAATPDAWTRSGVTIRGVYANGDPITNATDAANVVIDGDNAYQIAPLGKNPSYLTISGITFLNGSGQPVAGNAVFTGAHYNAVSNCVFEGCANGAAFAIGGQGNRIEDCVFRRNTSIGGSSISECAVLYLLGLRGQVATNYLRRCIFEGNGAADNLSCAAVVSHMTAVEDCTFRANIGCGYVALRSLYNRPWYAVVRDCTFTCNTNTDTTVGYSIASITDSGDGCIVSGCRFESNNAGGGHTFDPRGATNIVVQGCSFVSNRVAPRGTVKNLVSCSGIYFYAVSATRAYLTNCLFQANNGTLLQSRTSFTSVTADDCRFLENECDQVFYNKGATPIGYIGTTNIFNRCVFGGNNVDSSYTRFGMLQLGLSSFDRCVFTNNTSGASIIASYGSISMTNCLFACNSVTNNAVDGGGARGVDMFETGLNHIVNCTFVSNSTMRAVVYREVDGDEIANCIFAKNTWPYGDKLLQKSGTSNCFADFVPYGTWANLVGGTAGADPGFKDAAHGDYTLKRQSVCRNAGANAAWMAGAADLAGNARINADDKEAGVAIVDIGCYEWYRSNRGLMVIFR